MKIIDNYMEEFENLPHEEVVGKNFLKFIKALEKEKVPVGVTHSFVFLWLAKAHLQIGKLEDFKQNNEEIYQLVKDND